MSFWAVIVHYVFFGGALLYLHGRMMRLRRVTLLHISSFYYITTTLLFLPMLQDNDFSHLTDALWVRAFEVGCIFVAGCVAADTLFYRRRAATGDARSRITTDSLTLYVLFFLFGVAGFARYFFIGGAYQHVGEVLRLIKEGTPYYTARGFVSDSIGSVSGRGVAHATGSVSAVFPVVIAISYMLYHRSRRVIFVMIIAASVGISLLISSINMERGPLLFSIGVPVILLLLYTREETAERRLLRFMKWRSMSAFAAILILSSASMYAFTDKTGALESLRRGFERIFAVPGLTSLFYLNAFPEGFPFRGMSHVFYMSSDFSLSDTSTRVISLYATRIYSMNANTGILATAYTGGGLAGVGLVTALYLMVVVTIDKLYERQTGYARSVNLLVNACGIASLSDVPMGVAFTIGGFALPSLLLYLFFRSCGKSRAGAGRPDTPPDAGS